MNDPDDMLYDQGWRDGYRRGEAERVALATANSDLRSHTRELERELSSLRDVSGRSGVF